MRGRAVIVASSTLADSGGGAQVREPGRPMAKAPAKRKARRGRVARRSPEAARQEILDAAAACLTRHPFRELSVGLLMSHTQIGRSAFYVYFKDIYAVVEALMESIRDQELAYLAAWTRDDVAPQAALRQVLADTVNLWTVHGPMIAAMVDASADDERLEAMFAGVTAAYRQAVTGILRREREAGRIADIDYDEIATALVIGAQAYLKARLGHGGRRDPLKVAETLQAIWLSAIYGQAKREPLS